MPLLIKTTGLEEYAPGGAARIKVMMIGGPGAGKTRTSSFYPKPIYADCERGLASVADRNVPYVTIGTSTDILDLLAHLKQECKQPWENRQYQTIVIDTLDAFQRKVKNEWMEKEQKESFTGWEAWGYLTSQMQKLMTRLLNLDMNVIVNVHFKDKTIKDDETGRESHELMLQLQGESADTAFNDFDLVGWLGTYWATEDGVRVQKRGITFKPRPDKPFLKDRLHVTPEWLEVTFSETDYTNLFSRIQEKLATMESGEILGEVPPEQAQIPANVIAPGQIGTGALGASPTPSSAAGELPLEQLDKPTLLKRCRDLGIERDVDDNPIKGNTLKAELIAAIRKATEAAALEQPQLDAKPEQKPEQKSEQKSESKPEQKPEPRKVVKPEPIRMTDAPGISGPVANPDRTKADAPSAHQQAVDLVQDALGGVVAQDKVTPTSAASPAPAADAKAAAPKVCSECGKDLTGVSPDLLKLAHIKFRRLLCEEDYAKAKAGGR